MSRAPSCVPLPLRLLRRERRLVVPRWSVARSGRAERDRDARRRCAEAGVALVAGAAAVLADAYLGPALVRHDRRRHGDSAVAEQDVGREALTFVRGQAVDDERLAVADAVLLA